MVGHEFAAGSLGLEQGSDPGSAKEANYSNNEWWTVAQRLCAQQQGKSVFKEIKGCFFYIKIGLL